MDYKLSHHHKFFQKMVLTPQMRHSIKLLGMSTKDLHDYINAAIEQNPFLRKSYQEKRYENHRNGSSGWIASEAQEYYGANANVNEDNPRDSLLSQLRMMNLTERQLMIVEYLISEMDDNGFITAGLDEAAHDLSCEIDEVERCLVIIQSLEPPGIGARDIRECLQLQLKRANKANSLEYTIVSDYLNELARNDAAKIARLLAADEQKVRQAIENIKKLSPRPASSLLSKGAEWVVPDMIVRVRDNTIRIEPNREWLPRLQFFNPYENDPDVVNNPEAKVFVRENLKNAKHLVDTLKRREETMCKVAEYILTCHRDELLSGGNERKTLTIKEIAEVLNLHPSTVNRTVSNKYIQIHEQVMPLKSLLSHGIKKINGETTSKTEVKKKIKELVDNEDKTKPLSDRAIQAKLEEMGITIKRRTIAKYRQTLKILPTHLRRKIA